MNQNFKNIVLIKFKTSPSSDSTWQLPPENFSLLKNEVHLWRQSLNIATDEVEKLAKILAPDERERADRFRFPIHRKRFIVARATLRKILSSYLDLEPTKVQFQYSDRGKPSLKTPSLRAGFRIDFNISHSQDLAIYGFTKDRKIGIDLEYLRDMPDADNLAKRFFSANEYREIAALQTTEKQQIFLKIWTAKEAYLKATGEGLIGLDDVEIACNTQEVKIARIKQNSRAALNWYLSSFEIDRSYIAAIAVELNSTI